MDDKPLLAEALVVVTIEIVEYPKSERSSRLDVVRHTVAQETK